MGIVDALILFPPYSASPNNYNARWLLKKGMFNSDEMNLLLQAAKSDKALQDASKFRPVKDQHGKSSKLVLWSHPGDDIYGMFAQNQVLVDAVEQLLEDECYHYHSKVMLKEPLVGGAWEWHQDYGYWYKNGCLYPRMLSAMIAIDRADKENGCLQVLSGSNRIGRINHDGMGEGQQAADAERVAAALKRHELVFAELDPGDVFFLDCLTLHTSGMLRFSLSPICGSFLTENRPRWSYIIAYNAKSNDPLKVHHHPNYVPLKRVPRDAILKCGMRIDSTSREFNTDAKPEFKEVYQDDCTVTKKI